MTEKVTYNSLLEDDEFLNNAWNALQAQGINVSNERKDILDRFLTNKRYFDTNIASTFVIGDNVKDMSEANKQSYAWAPVPYDFFFTLFIYARNNRDASMIVEQILPFFQLLSKVLLDDLYLIMLHVY